MKMLHLWLPIDPKNNTPLYDYEGFPLRVYSARGYFFGRKPPLPGNMHKKLITTRPVTPA